MDGSGRRRWVSKEKKKRPERTSLYQIQRWSKLMDGSGQRRWVKKKGPRNNLLVSNTKVVERWVSGEKNAIRMVEPNKEFSLYNKSPD
jgi:hypothetical protein